MNSAARHVDGFDLAGRQAFHRVKVAFANLEIIFDDLAERPQRKMELSYSFSILRRHIKNQPPLSDRQSQAEGPVRHGLAFPLWQRETVVFQQVVDRDLSLLFDFGCGRGKARLVNFDMADAGHFRSSVAGHTGLMAQTWRGCKRSVVEFVQPCADRQPMRLQTFRLRKPLGRRTDGAQRGGCHLRQCGALDEIEYRKTA